MLLPASQEYIALCQSQVSLLMQGIGATEIAVYMTEQFESDASLTPLVIYPESNNFWPNLDKWALKSANNVSISKPLLLEASGAPNENPIDAVEIPVVPHPLDQDDPEIISGSTNGAQRQQLVLPLMHDNAVLGILMVARLGPSWSVKEQAQVEQVAQTLSMACVLDQRSQWLSRSGFEKQAVLTDEHQRLSKLLHQFRNPLTALRTLGKLMLRRMNSQDPNKEFAQSIVQQSDRLEMMLKEFSQTLDVGEEAIETFDQGWNLEPSSNPPVLLPAAGVISGASLNLQPCWLKEILAPILQALASRLEERQMTLKQLITEDLPPIKGDTQALTEIFSNLFDNAIKYTPDGGIITIQLEQQQQQNGPTFQKVSISDTGYGIPKADLIKIFEGEYRGIQAASDIPGTGLGLAIAQDLIEKMNGSIEAFSPALTSQSKQFRKHFHNQSSRTASGVKSYSSSAYF